MESSVDVMGEVRGEEKKTCLESGEDHGLDKVSNEDEVLEHPQRGHVHRHVKERQAHKPIVVVQTLGQDLIVSLHRAIELTFGPLE